ncbi:MAG: hypothetical protein ACK4F7_06635, partial [Inhella sp.]
PLDGWSAVPGAAGKTPGFEVWTDGDRMSNDIGNAVTVRPADAANGRQWIGLRNGSRTQAHQAIGLERQVQTEAGALYTLSFDYAAHPGLASSNTAIGVYVDGVRIGIHAGSSPRTALSWQALSFQFVGQGGMQRVTLLLEGGTDPAVSVATQRGALIDDIRLLETLRAQPGRVYALAEAPSALPAVSASLRDPGERLVLELLGLRAGMQLSDGSRSWTVVQDGQALDLSGWQLDRLTVQVPLGLAGDHVLEWRATSTEPSNGSTASRSESVTLRVLVGAAVSTPVGANAWVSLQTQMQSQAQARAASSGGAHTALDADAADRPMVASLQRDTWLVELERRSRKQWESLMVKA